MEAVAIKKLAETAEQLKRDFAELFHVEQVERFDYEDAEIGKIINEQALLINMRLDSISESFEIIEKLTK